VAKQSGLGDNLWIDGYELGGDVGSLQRIACPLAVQEVPSIKQSAQDRLGLKHDGGIDFTAYFNPATTAGAEGAHAILSSLPTIDRIVTYGRGTVAGSPAASEVTKQIGYDGTRGDDGSFTFSISSQANGYGLDWGVLLTDSPRTDTTATTPATGLDLGASPTSYSQGWVAYLHLLAFTGTSVTVTLEDSANNSAFTGLTGGAFTAQTARGAVRLAQVGGWTVRRYVRAVTTGTFSNAVFTINFVRYEAAAS
jgi:hypothetical protein